MILVLNREMVLLEAIELARYKVAQVLQCSPRHVEAEIQVKDGKPVPVFSVPQNVAEGLEAAQIKEVLSSVYWGVRHELAERLEYLDTRRP